MTGNLSYLVTQCNAAHSPSRSRDRKVHCAVQHSTNTQCHRFGVLAHPMVSNRAFASVSAFIKSPNNINNIPLRVAHGLPVTLQRNLKKQSMSTFTYCEYGPEEQQPLHTFARFSFVVSRLGYKHFPISCAGNYFKKKLQGDTT